MISIVYDDLRRRAAALLRRERRDHTLDPTALVHEAYLRLVNQRTADWNDRAHFFGAAVGIMRHILVDHARGRGRAKRGGAWQRVGLVEGVAGAGPRDVDLLALDAGITELASLDASQARIVELRYFGGLSIEETAEVLGVSTSTVKRDFSTARAWLYRRLARSEPSP